MRPLRLSLLVLAVSVVWSLGAGTASADTDLDRTYSGGVWHAFDVAPAELIDGIWHFGDAFQGIVVVDSVGGDWVSGAHEFSFVTQDFAGGTLCARVGVSLFGYQTGYSHFEQLTICGDGGFTWLTFSWSKPFLGGAAGDTYSITVMRFGVHPDDTLPGDLLFYAGRFTYRSDLETEGMEGKLTEVQGAELLDGLQALVYFAGIGVAVVVASLLAALLSFFRR